jgi:hypothetical protein
VPVLATIHLAFQDLWPLLGLPFALGLAWLGYRRTTPPLVTRQRVPLVALRTLSYALLLIVLASPVLNRMRNEPMRPRIAVLVDESASMSNVDAASGLKGPQRIERARGILQSLANSLRGAGVDLEVVPFSGTAEAPLQPDAYLRDGRPAAGAGTDVVGALHATSDRLAGQNLQALVLLTDGRPTRGGLDPTSPAGLGQPVFTIGFGDTLAARDLAIERCDYPQVAYVQSETPVDVQLENSGFRGRSTTLRLLQGERELFHQNVSFDQEHGRTSVQIPLKLETPGRQRFQLVLAPLAEEATQKNNARELSIEVLKNRIRVLVLAARPDWDVSFLGKALRDDPNVQLTLAHQNVGGTWVKSEDASELVLPRGAKALEEYDLYIVGSPGPQAQPALWKDLLSAVERGKGLLLLAGRESAFTSAGAFEALSPALPVQRTRARAPQFQMLAVRLTPQGRHHPATAGLADLADASGELGVLPPLLADHVELGAKPGALVLLSAVSQQAAPILVAGRYGQGQTAVLTGFPIWRWAFTDREPVRRAALQFEGNLVRWLTQPRDVRQVQVLSAKSVYESGESAEFFVHVLDAQYAPLDDAEVHLEVHRQDGEKGTTGTLLLQRRPGHSGEYAGSLPGLGPGEYEARVVATRSGAEIGRDTTRFTVDAYSVEFANLSQDVDFLRELAARTGGRYATPDRAAELWPQLPRQPRPVLLRSEIEIWNTTPFFLLFVLTLSAEWLLRKRHGLL